MRQYFPQQRQFSKNKSSIQRTFFALPVAFIFQISLKSLSKIIIHSYMLLRKESANTRHQKNGLSTAFYFAIAL